MYLCLAIGRVETLVDHHGADDIGRVDRCPRPAKRVEHAPRQFSMLEPNLPIRFAANHVAGCVQWPL